MHHDAFKISYYVKCRDINFASHYVDCDERSSALFSKHVKGTCKQMLFFFRHIKAAAVLAGFKILFRL